MAEAAGGTPTGVEGDKNQATVTDADAVLAAAKAAEDKATAEKAAAGGGGDRPAWLPEKFKTAEDLAKGYAALEQKQSAGDKPALDVKPGAESLLIDTSTPKPGAEDSINMAALEKEFNDNSGLTDETYKALEKRGLSRSDADSIIEGRLAQGMQLRVSMAEVTGGEEGLQKTLSWAKANTDKQELDAYNAAVATKNPGQIRLALRGLHAGYVAAHGIPPKLVDGVPGGEGVTGFASQEEMANAIDDKRYNESAAYRAEVAARIAKME